jgi:hypothetical protein
MAGTEYKTEKILGIVTSLPKDTEVNIQNVAEQSGTAISTVMSVMRGVKCKTDLPNGKFGMSERHCSICVAFNGESARGRIKVVCPVVRRGENKG